MSDAQRLLKMIEVYHRQLSEYLSLRHVAYGDDVPKGEHELRSYSAGVHATAAPDGWKSHYDEDLDLLVSVLPRTFGGEPHAWFAYRVSTWERLSFDDFFADFESKTLLLLLAHL